MEKDGVPSSDKDAFDRRVLGRDVIVTPWQSEGWAVIKVGGKRPGRTRLTKEAAVRLGQGLARDERSRLFVTDVAVTFARIEALLREGALDDETRGLGRPVLDLRNPVGRIQRRQDEMAARADEKAPASIGRRE